MGIKRITVSNFRSFEHLDMELSKFNVLIGANASGKSNFVEIFRFLRDIGRYGLDDAISMHGGIEYLRNTRIGSARDLSLKFVSDEELTVPIIRKEGVLFGETSEITYEFAIHFEKGRKGFKVSEDRLTLKCHGFRAFVGTDMKTLGPGEVMLSNVGGRVQYDFKLPKGISIGEEDIFARLLEAEKIPGGALLIEAPLILPVFGELRSFLANIPTYDFDPKEAKKAVPISGKTELEENASNLAIALKNIIESKDKRRKFYNLLTDLLPFVDALKVGKFAERSLFLKFREKYCPDLYLPAFLISDGTMNITALIIVLYFEEKPLIIMEEPERNIHPYLISKVVNMLKEASEKKQIIVTTHNPEVVKYAGLEDLLLVSRNKEGFSTISRPSEKEEVRTFLRHEIGIEELYIQNLLGT